LSLKVPDIENQQSSNQKQQLSHFKDLTVQRKKPPHFLEPSSKYSKSSNFFDSKKFTYLGPHYPKKINGIQYNKVLINF